MKDKKAKRISAAQEIAEIKKLLGYVTTPDFSCDYWVRLDGRLNGQLRNLAEKLLTLLERDYPTPPAKLHCCCCHGHD